MTTLIPKVSLWALLPMVVFLVLTLRGKNYTLSVGIASLLGCLLTLQGPLQFANMLVKKSWRHPGTGWFDHYVRCWIGKRHGSFRHQQNRCHFCGKQSRR